MAQFAQELQAKDKGVIFIGDSFIVGLLGSGGVLNVASIEEFAKTISTKETKSRQQDQVKFDSKEKGKKPVVTKGVVFFSITGADFNYERLS